MKGSHKFIVVRGAGSGIGRALSLHLLVKQARVVGVDINLNSLLETQKIAGGSDDKFKVFALDIIDKQKFESLPNEVIAHVGAVDGIIYNLGIIQHFIHVKDLTYHEINRVFKVNFFGTLNLTKAFLPHFLKRPQALKLERMQLSLIFSVVLVQNTPPILFKRKWLN